MIKESHYITDKESCVTSKISLLDSTYRGLHMCPEYIYI